MDVRYKCPNLEVSDSLTSIASIFDRKVFAHFDELYRTCNYDMLYQKAVDSETVDTFLTTASYYSYFADGTITDSDCSLDL